MKIRKISAAILIFAVILGVFIPFSSSAESTNTAHLTLEKTVFKVGEAINVTATRANSDKDWVGIMSSTGSASLWYYYVSDVGNGTIVNINDTTNSKITKTSSSYTSPLPAGKYKVIFIENDKTVASAGSYEYIEISIGNDTALPLAPIDVKYTIANEASGFAEGTVEVNLPAVSNAKEIIMYWANESGKLDGYTSFNRIKVTNTNMKITLPKGMIIPQGATKLLVYTKSGMGLSEDFFSVDLSKDSNMIFSEKPNVEFNVISDIHINISNNDVYNQNYVKLLQDIVKTSPKSSGVIVVGDIANTGNATEYKNFNTLSNSVINSPYIYTAIGNHDYYYPSKTQTTTAKTVIDNFIANGQLGQNSTNKIYYSFELRGYKFIILGSEATGGGATLSLTQLKWLKENLEESYTKDPNKPVFVFLHQPMYNTVSGSLPGEGWHGVISEDALRQQLKDYPNVVFFTGHTHWVLGEKETMYNPTSTLPIHMFNTASAAYLWTGYNIAAGEYQAGSQGYYINVYNDTVLVRGRDFTTGEWIPQAQFAFSTVNVKESETSEIGETTELPETSEPTALEKKGCRSTSPTAFVVLPALSLFTNIFDKKKHKKNQE